MKPFYSLTKVEQSLAKASALQWYEKHKDHVDRLRARAQKPYPPSGSDCFSPELWKAEHWRWLLGAGETVED